MFHAHKHTRAHAHPRIPHGLHTHARRCLCVGISVDPSARTPVLPLSKVAFSQPPARTFEKAGGGGRYGWVVTTPSPIPQLSFLYPPRGLPLPEYPPALARPAGRVPGFLPLRRPGRRGGCGAESLGPSHVTPPSGPSLPCLIGIWLVETICSSPACFHGNQVA